MPDFPVRSIPVRKYQETSIRRHTCLNQGRNLSRWQRRPTTAMHHALLTKRFCVEQIQVVVALSTAGVVLIFLPMP